MWALSNRCLYRFKSSNWSGLVIAISIAGIGLTLTMAGGVFSKTATHSLIALVGVGFSLISLPLTAGACYHLFKIQQSHRRFPMPGRLVGAKGERMHLLAEGESNGRPTVVWLTGKHDQGLILHHLHKKMCRRTRSILFDRPGSGWSDSGSAQRTVVREASELSQLLENADEQGPFVLVPWSFSGLLVTTFAELYPAKVAGLVLLDVTSGNYPVFDRQAQIAAMCRQATIAAWRSRFGLEWNPRSRLSAAEIVQFETLYKDIADVQEAIIANNAQPRFHHATRSALLCSATDVFGATQIAGSLGDLPLFVLLPDDADEQAKQVANRYYHTDFERENARRFCESVRLELSDLSTQGEIRLAPKGTSHSFPFEVPDYVLQQVDEMVARCSHSDIRPVNAAEDES